VGHAANLLLLFLSKNLNDPSTFGKVIGKKIDYLKHCVHCSAVQLKDNLTRDVTWRAGTVATASY